jgi:hypothetical protein
MMMRRWEDMIAVNTADEPVFSVLPPVAELADRVNWSVPVRDFQRVGDLGVWGDA